MLPIVTKRTDGQSIPYGSLTTQIWNASEIFSKHISLLYFNDSKKNEQ